MQREASEFAFDNGKLSIGIAQTMPLNVAISTRILFPTKIACCSVNCIILIDWPYLCYAIVICHLS